MSEIFIRMLEITAVSSAIILAVFIFRAILAKRIEPGAIGILWALALLRLCLPFTLESPLHLPQRMPQQQDGAAGQPAYTGVSDPVYVPADSVPEAGHIPETVYEFTPEINTEYEPVPAGPTAEAGFYVDWLDIAAYVWLAGAAAILLLAAWKGASFGRRVKRCEEHENADQIADGIKAALKIRRKVPVKVCAGISAPVLFGLLKPRILLPESCRSIDGEALRCILAHELCHVKRHDLLKGYIWLMAKAAHWFNPLVWLAYSACKDDIELCCDDMVLRLIGKGNRFLYTQSLIEVFRSYRHALPAAVPLFEKRPKLTERVMRMLKPCKRSKTAAALSAFLALIILVAGFTTACSPAAETADTTDTPQPTAVVQPTEKPEPTPVPTPEPYTVSRWTDTAEDGRLTIDINAEVIIPNVSEFPMYKVKEAELSQETVDKLKDFFFGDETVYEYTSSMMHEEGLEESNKKYAAMQDGTYDFSGYSGTKQECMAGMRAHINSLKKLISKEPDTGLVPLDMTLANHEYEMNGITESGDRVYAWKGMPRIFFSKHDPNLERDVNNKYIKQPEPAAISREEALAQAAALIEELGLSDFRFYKDNSAFMQGNEYRVDDLLNGNDPSIHPYVYGFVFTRVVGGIQLASSYSRPDIDNNDMKTFNKFAENFNEETIHISVNDSGICGFNWMAVIDTEPADSNTQLKGIEEIKQTVIEQLLKKYADVGDHDRTDTKNDEEYYKLEHYTVHVKSMQLEYARVPVGGDYDTPYLVPVWNVYATNERSTWRIVNGEEVLKDSSSPLISIELTINALDGSVIGTVTEIN